MQKIARKLPINLSLFIASLLTASLLGILALKKGENISSIWIIICSASIYIIFYRFYSKWIALKILNLDSERATPAIKINDGNDFVPTNRWIVFGHHFAAIAGPGPLIGPTLATQFGYLPSILWIVIGAVIGGAVQDMIILFASVRREGKSLGQMIKDEISPLAGFIALFTTLSIIIILIAVLGLIVVKALMHSPW
jgi:carbon starvation protein